MNSQRAVIIILFACSLNFATIAKSTEIAGNYTLTLDEAKKIAVERNPLLASYKSQIDAASAREARISSKFYPTLETKWGNELNLTGSTGEKSSFGYLSGSWNLYRGGQDSELAKSKYLEEQRARIDYDIQKFIIENRVESVFYNMLYLRDIRQIKQRFIEINNDQQNFARQFVARGSGSESDVVQFDIRFATLNSELAQIDQDAASYLIKLKSLIGDDIAKNPNPAGELPHQHLVGTLADYANNELKDAPTVQVAALNLGIATHKAVASKGRWLPQLDIEGRFGSLPLSEGGSQSELSSSITFIATWELFGGFDTSYEIKEMLAEKSSADWMLKAKIVDILADIQTDFGELVAIEKRSDLAKNNVPVAKKYYDLVFHDFKRGYKNSTDFSAAAEVWYEAEVQKKKFDLDFSEKRLALEAKIGKKIGSNAMTDEYKKIGDKPVK